MNFYSGDPDLCWASGFSGISILSELLGSLEGRAMGELEPFIQGGLEVLMSLGNLRKERAHILLQFTNSG